MGLINVTLDHVALMKAERAFQSCGGTDRNKMKAAIAVYLDVLPPAASQPALAVKGVTDATVEAAELAGDEECARLGRACPPTSVYRAALTAATGAGGQAVACNHDWEKTREDACMFVCSKCRVAYNGNVLTDKPKGWTGKYQGSSSITAHPAHNGQGGL